MSGLLDYGKREGSDQYKSHGYFGPIKIPGTNGVATEFSIDSELNGKPVQFPSIVPTLTSDDINMLFGVMKQNGRIPDAIYQKAIDHAQYRIAMGQSPFWRIPEKQYQIPKGGLLGLDDVTTTDGLLK